MNQPGPCQRGFMRSTASHFSPWAVRLLASSCAVQPMPIGAPWSRADVCSVSLVSGKH